MERSEFTKKCQIAEDALREVLKEIDENNEDVYCSIRDTVYLLYNLAIPEGPFIGRSVMKCLLIEEEDECNLVELGTEQDRAEQTNWFSRWIRLFFDNMDEMGITRMNKGVYGVIRGMSIENEDIIKILEESDEAQKNIFKEEITEIMQARPDYFEMGKPESSIECDESCRGTGEVISRAQCSEGVSCTITTRPDRCLYKDWL
jgi:hypothetical protein